MCQVLEQWAGAPCSSCAHLWGAMSCYGAESSLAGLWLGHGQREFVFVHKSSKGSFMQPATVIAWHGPCSPWSGPLAQLQLGSAMSGASSDSKGLSAFARRRRARLLVGNEMEELLLLLGTVMQPTLPASARVWLTTLHPNGLLGAWHGSSCLALHPERLCLAFNEFSLSPQVGRQGSSWFLSACQC